ncbi:lysophospholipid transporter LplT [Limnohabitans sp. G3-2]|uniref:lysophospholipid transporter LplT n=1 Tax=Limnohabitans sp. G3-2 TaxID=1100711 RepID=UPI000C1DF55B|nr:lysophospholipid transporter LplT [Limnohabitans sp. G3-2]PIT75630.1 lysophospholipid transporter LplT [Limnohabitans sp. G3-2]
MPKGFYFLILAQFASGLADNAFMILGVFFLQEQGYSAWWAPLLKFAFTLSYVVLASVAGSVADAFPKSRLMAAMNLLKFTGVFLLLAGVHPLLSFAMTGLAAALYAPAKYGLVSEAVPTRLLVKANAWLEVSVVLSVMLGVALGGGLIQWQLGSGQTSWLSWSAGPQWWVGTQVRDAFGVVCGIYGVSALLNMGVSPLKSRRCIPLTWRGLQWSVFWKHNRQLWADPLGGMSLHVTTLCWGSGAVLQFAVLRWAQTNAELTLQQGAYLQAVVALGVMGGATMAAYQSRIFNARRALPWGLVLAAVLPTMALVHALPLALPLLLLSGWAGGMLLVPMNALLQHRGLRIMNPGQSIAVQGFNENLSVLVMLGLYSALLAWELPLLPIMLLLALPLLGAVLPWLRRRA